LVLLSHPLATLLFEHGEFTADDASRVARMISCYGLGVWAFCALPVIVRGFYALGDLRAPLRAAAAAMLTNVGLNLLLIWPLAEAGLALATSLAAVLQVALLSAQFSRRWGNLRIRKIGRTVASTSLASVAMLVGGHLALAWLPTEPGALASLMRVGLPMTVGIVIFFAVSRKLRIAELDMLLGRQAGDER
jgi:putative peptidoglycan lipid II flippase